MGVLLVLFVILWLLCNVGCWIVIKFEGGWWWCFYEIFRWFCLFYFCWGVLYDLGWFLGVGVNLKIEWGNRGVGMMLIYGYGVGGWCKG